MTRDELLNFTWKEDDGSLHPIIPSEACKINMLLNYQRHLKERVNVSSFRKFKHAPITRNSWTRHVNHPNQQRLVDFYDKIYHAQPKIEEPESFISKKDHSPKTSKIDLSSKNKESPFRQAMQSSSVHTFRSSNGQYPSDCEINEAPNIETSKTLKQSSETSKQSFQPHQMILHTKNLNQMNLVHLRLHLLTSFLCASILILLVITILQDVRSKNQRFKSLILFLTKNDFSLQIILHSSLILSKKRLITT